MGADDEQSFAVGSFASSPIRRLADVLREKDEAAVRQRLHKDFGIEVVQLKGGAGFPYVCGLRPMGSHFGW